MAGLAHAGIGLASKRIAPKIPVWILILTAYGIDILWGIFFLAGLERLPDSNAGTSPWTHGLFMAVVWSILAGLFTLLLSKDRRTSLIIALLFFSHWVLDFISHPMRAVFPDATGLPLLFEGSPTVGLGLWSTQLGVNIGEYGITALGLLIYIMTVRSLKKQKYDETENHGSA
ncbi:MAG: hypothetical protein JXA13_03395 [Anaerolineales bacterium]|nr:hypothetical protein [Anaerolineales bacterium]